MKGFRQVPGAFLFVANGVQSRVFLSKKQQFFSGHPENGVLDYKPARRSDPYSKSRIRKTQLPKQQ